MKKLLLFTFVAFLLAVPANAKKPKLAQDVFFLMERQINKEKRSNDSIRINYKIIYTNLNGQSEGVRFQPHLVITVNNKTERTIFIDLQNSFLVVNGESFPMFTNTTNVSTQGSTSLTGVNLGLVGVGAANSEFNTKMTHEQRIISVPEESKKAVDLPLVTKWGVSWKLNNVNGSLAIFPKGTNCNHWDYFIIYQDFINKGQVLNYEADDSPLTIDVRMCYSFTEDLATTFVNKSQFSAIHIVGSTGYAEAKKLFPDIDSYEQSENKLNLFVCTKNAFGF